MVDITLRVWVKTRGTALREHKVQSSVPIYHSVSDRPRVQTCPESSWSIYIYIYIYTYIDRECDTDIVVCLGVGDRAFLVHLGVPGLPGAWVG